MLLHYLWKVKVQICGKLRTRWTFGRAIMVSSLSIRGWRSTAAITKLSPSVWWAVDEIKLNYSLANTTLQYIRVAISGCVHCVSVKCLLVYYSDITISSSVFSHHTRIRPKGGGVVRTQRTPWIRHWDCQRMCISLVCLYLFKFLLQSKCIAGFRRTKSRHL